jgi:class 3 adenylate cyclase/predicted ATPase
MSDIASWLEENGLGAYAERFTAERIDHDILPQLTDEALTALGLPLGDRLRLLGAIKDLEALPAPRQEAERRQITVMFCDLVGSTALSEKLDPEDLRTLMQNYQQAAGAVIERYGGHVAQYLGDGLMTYFGWPQAHEDDAERAVRASLDIVEAINAMDLAVRVGIATGPVVVGETGAGDASVPKLAVGETPNLASRLQGLAGADEIIIGHSTRRLVAGTFELEDLGGQTLKGIVEPVPAHRVIGIADTEGRFEARTPHMTPFVGREAEMAMVMSRWEQTKTGEGQVLLISGEPGIGKSRITQTLRERMSDEPHTRLRYQCSPYHTNSALHPVIEQLERAANFQRADTAKQKLDKLERLFLGGEQPHALMASLLSLPTDRYPALAMSPQKQKEETLRVLAEQVLWLASKQPVLLIFEDVHWMDPTSQELLDLIVPMVTDHEVLVVIAFRPEYEPPWLGQGHVTPLALQRLGKSDAAAMVASVSDRALSDDILEQIVAKTDGVPLFLEELTKTVQESGTETANAIPETLQDSLMARLDRLSPVKEIAQIGACIGREFSHELLVAVSPIGDNELGDALQQLVNSELVFRRGTGANATYTFKHALMQDAAYKGLLKAQRRHLHQSIAAAYETLFPSMVETAPEVLARHHENAGFDDKAADLWMHAGGLNLANSALIEAIGHLRQGLSCIDRLDPTEGNRKREFDTRNLLGTAYMALKSWAAPEVEDVLTPAWELAQELGQWDDIGGLLWALCMHSLTTGEILDSISWVNQILSIAEDREDMTLELVGQTASVVCHFFHADFETTKAASERIAKIYDPKAHGELVNQLNHDPVVISGIYESYWRWITGKPDQAVEVTHETAKLAESQGHPFNHGFALGFGSGAFFLTGIVDELRRREATLIKIARDHAIPFLEFMQAKLCGMRVLFHAGRYQESVEKNRSATESWLAAGGTVGYPYWMTLMASALFELADFDEAFACIETAHRMCEQTQELWCLAEVYRLYGEIYRRQPKPDPDRAQKWLRKAIELAQRQSAKGWELRAATSLARLWQSQGKTQEAHDLLAPVYGWFTEGFDTPDLIDAKALLDELGVA